MNYSEKTLYYFNHTQHAGILEAKPTVKIGSAISQSTQDAVKFFVNIQDGQIQEIKFQANGGVALIASAEYLASECEAKALTFMAELQAEQILNALELPKTKIHSVVLVLGALKSAFGPL